MAAHAPTRSKKFRPPFQRWRVTRAAPLDALRRARNLILAFLFAKLFLCACFSKEKAAYDNAVILRLHKTDKKLDKNRDDRRSSLFSLLYIVSNLGVQIFIYLRSRKKQRHPLSAFSLATQAQRKSSQKETPQEISPSADGDEGSAPSTAPPFEKGGRKLFNHLQPCGGRKLSFLRVRIGGCPSRCVSEVLQQFLPRLRGR